MFGLKRNESKTANEGRGNSNGHLIDLRQVVKTFESTAGIFTALKGIDLKVGDGEFLSIVGKSGSGKSTLINMVTGIDRPTSGQVMVGDTAVHGLNEEQIAVWRGHTIGVIFQFFQLLPTLTAAENIMLPSERPERAMVLLEKMGMADYAHKLPSELSGGQQQCIAIARALANNPPILAADEPTGNLDSKAAESVLRLFENLVDSGKTILMVTHDHELAGRALRTLMLADGRIVDDKTNGVLRP
jgi:putative ABC transport system ATP-binding protein